MGLSAHGLPELVVTGARAEAAAEVLQRWGDYLLDTSLVLPGETLEAGPWLMEAVEVEQPQEHVLMAARLYGERIRGLQLAWADARGVWPREPGYRARRAGQPLLGRRTPGYCDEHRPDRLDVRRPCRERGAWIATAAGTNLARVTEPKWRSSCSHRWTSRAVRSCASLSPPWLDSVVMLRRD